MRPVIFQQATANAFSQNYRQIMNFKPLLVADQQSVTFTQMICFDYHSRSITEISVVGQATNNGKYKE